MNRGWVKLWRRALDNPDLQQFDALGLWATLLLKARREDGSEKINGVRADVKRGQVAVSLAKLAEEGGMTRGRLRALTTKLIDEGMIEVNHVTAKLWSIVTICNYEEYQASAPAEKPSYDQATTKLQPTEQPTVQEGEKGKTPRVSTTAAVDSDSRTRAAAALEGVGEPEETRPAASTKVAGLPEDVVAEAVEQAAKFLYTPARTRRELTTLIQLAGTVALARHAIDKALAPGQRGNPISYAFGVVKGHFQDMEEARERGRSGAGGPPSRAGSDAPVPRRNVRQLPKTGGAYDYLPGMKPEDDLTGMYPLDDLTGMKPHGSA